jgi:hypothetical protein
MSTLNGIQVSSAQSAEKGIVGCWNSNAAMTIQACASIIMDYAIYADRFSQNLTLLLLKNSSENYAQRTLLNAKAVYRLSELMKAGSARQAGKDTAAPA